VTAPVGDAAASALRLAGEIDLANVTEHRGRILAAGLGGSVVLDLDEVEYLDSAGINMLDDVAAEFAANGCTLTIVCSPGSVCRRVLELGAPGLLLSDAV